MEPEIYVILKGTVRLCYPMDQIGQNANLAKQVLSLGGMKDKVELVGKHRETPKTIENQDMKRRTVITEGTQNWPKGARQRDSTYVSEAG